MNNKTAILEANNLSRTVTSNGNSIKIVDNFSYSFNKGVLYTIMGPSGAGKSSLLRLFSLLDEPSSGKIKYNDLETEAINPCQYRQNVGYLFQEPYLFEGTVADNFHYVDQNLTNESIVELLEIVSFDKRKISQNVIELSTGEKQRVAMARLLATKPEIILLDEPTSALDPTYTELIEKSIKEIMINQKLTVIMISHHPQQAVRMGGNGLLMVAGKLVEHGQAEQLVNNPATELGRRYRDLELK